MRRRRLAQRELAIGERAQLALCPHRPDLLAQCRDDRRLLCHAARAQCRAGDGQVFALDRAEIGLDLRPTHQGDEAQPSLVGEQVDLPRDIVAAHHVEDRVDAAPAGELAAHGDEVLGAVVDRDIGAEVPAGGAFRLRPRGGQHLAAPCLGELDRGDADAAGTALDQERLARLQMHPVEHVGPHGAERLGQAAGIDQVHALRDRQALHRRHRGVFAVSVANHQRADLIAIPPCGDVLTAFHDRTGAFQAWDVGRAGRHRVAAHALKAVRAVHPTGGDADQHLPCLRLRHRAPHGHQHLGPARPADLDHGLSGWDVGEHGRRSCAFFRASVWQIARPRASAAPVVRCAAAWGEPWLRSSR